MFDWLKKKPEQQHHQSPHEIFPQILHWQKGDELGGDSRIRFHSFVRVLADGTVITERYDILYNWDIAWVKRSATNVSLRTRRLRERMADEGQYEQLIRNFQKAYEELQREDD